MRTEDGYIISRCLDGDSTAFGFLVDKYKAGVYASAYGKLQNFHDAEDVTQEVFLKAYRSLRALRRWDSFASWLYRITFNLCKDWLRAKSRRPDREFIEDQDQEILEIPSRKTYDQELACQSVRETLNSLPEMYCQVLTLHYFGGMTSAEIARFVGASPAAIRMRLRKARLLLKEEVFAMMNTTFEEQKLQATFTFRIMEAIKRIKIQSTPRMTDIPLGLSLATGIIFAVLSLNPHMNILGHTKTPMGPQLPVKSEITGAIPVDMLAASQLSIRSGRRGNRNPVIMANVIRPGRAPEDANLRLEQLEMVIQYTIDRTENMIRQQQLLLDGLKIQLEEVRQLRRDIMGMDTQIWTRVEPEPPSFAPAFPFTDRLEVNVELPSETKEKLLQGGDFENRLSGWEVKYATDLLDSDRTTQVVYDDDMGSDVIEFRRTNGGATGSIIGLYQDVYIDLSKYADVRLKLDVKPIYHNLTGGGWAGGVEYPVTLQVVFIDQRGEPHTWSHGFYYNDVSRYGDATKVDENAWFSYTSPNLLGARPDCSDEARVKDRLGWSQPVHRYVEPVVPTHITRVLIMGGGWDYTGRADNIELIMTSVLFSVAAEFQSDLNNEDISETLRQKFNDHGVSLSDDAFVTVKEKGMEWLITDGDKTYIIKKQGDKLNIY